MNIDNEIIDWIKGYIEEDLLDEDEYEYYIDEVALAIDPTVVHVLLYTEAPENVVKYLAKSGLVFSNNMDNCQTMSYRNMLYVTLMTSKERYNQMKDENRKMESISLENIVGWAKTRKYEDADIISLLRKATLCTC